MACPAVDRGQHGGRPRRGGRCGVPPSGSAPWKTARAPCTKSSRTASHRVRRKRPVSSACGGRSAWTSWLMLVCASARLSTSASAGLDRVPVMPTYLVARFHLEAALAAGLYHEDAAVQVQRRRRTARRDRPSLTTELHRARLRVGRCVVPRSIWRVRRRPADSSGALPESWAEDSGSKPRTSLSWWSKLKAPRADPARPNVRVWSWRDARMGR